MADDLTDRGARDRARINVNEPHEVKYWTKELEIDEDTLRKAVAEVGTFARVVRDHLQHRPGR